jgi:hypothetical protein
MISFLPPARPSTPAAVYLNVLPGEARQSIQAFNWLGIPKLYIGAPCRGGLARTAATECASLDTRQKRGFQRTPHPLNIVDWGEPFNRYQVRTLQPQPDKQENNMKKTLAIAAAAMLIGSSGPGFAGSATRGASGSAPGTQMNNSNSTNSRGASELSPGDRMKDSSTTGMSRGATKGASEFAPGDKMNDARKK